MSASPAERRLSAQRAAHTRWAHTRDRAAAMEPARRGFLDRLAKQVDPHGELDERDLAVAVESARKAFYADIAAKSAKVRRKRKEGAA